MANDYLKLGEQICAKQIFHEYSVKASRVLVEVNKDNEFIYHERIPDPKNLDRVPKAGLSKPLPLQPRLGTKFEGKKILKW